MCLGDMNYSYHTCAHSNSLNTTVLTLSYIYLWVNVLKTCNIGGKFKFQLKLGLKLNYTLSLGSHVSDFRFATAICDCDFCALIYAIFMCDFRVKSAILYFILKLEWVIFWKIAAANRSRKSHTWEYFHWNSKDTKHCSRKSLTWEPRLSLRIVTSTNFYMSKYLFN